MRRIKYPSVDYVEWLHDRILDLTGGERGDLTRSNLEFVLERVKDVGEDLSNQQAIVKKAAFILYSLVTQHPFINGNKRTAFEVAETFLEVNGYLIRKKREEKFSLLSEIAAGKLDPSQIEDWIETNLAKKRGRSG